MYKVKDNAEAQLQFGISSVATTLVVKEGQGASFPEVPFLTVLNKRNSDGEITKSEKVEVSAVSGDQFTISRGYEGTTPSDFSADDFVSLFVLAKHIEELQTEVVKKANQTEVESVAQRTDSLEEKMSTAEEQIQGIQTSIQEMGAVKGLSFKAIPNSEIVKEKKILIASSLIRGNADIYSYVSPYILQINFGKSLHKIKEVKSDKFYFSFPVEGMVDEEVNFTFKLSSGYIGDQIIHTETRNFKIKNKIRNEIIFEVPRNIIEQIEASVTDCVAVISCPQNKVLVHIFGSYNKDGFGNMGINDSYYDKSFEFYIYAQFTLPFNCLGIGKYGLEETYKNFIGITLGETKGHKIDKVEGDVLLEGKIIARKISTTKKETIKGCRFRATSNSGSGKFSIYGADENGNIQLTNKIFEKDFVCSAFGKQVVNGSNTFHNYQIPDGFEFIAKKDGYIRFGGLGIRHDSQFYIRLLINDNVVRTLNYPRATNKEQSFDYFVKKGEKVKMQVYGYFDKLYLYSLDQETSIAFKLNLDANKTYYLLLEGIDSCFGMKEFDVKFTSENPELASIRNIPHGDFVLKKGNLNEKILVYSSIVHHISVSNNVDDQPFYLENNVEQLFIKLYRNHNERLLKIVPKQVYLSQSSSLSTIQLGEGIVDIGLIYESGDPVEILVNGGIVELSEVNLIPGKKYCLHKGLLLTEDEIIQKNYRHYGIFGIAITEHLLFMNYVPTNTDIKTGNIPLGMPMGYATIGGHVVPIYG